MKYRALLSAFALASIFVPVAQAAGTYSDPQGRFSVALPADWEAVQPDNKQIAVVMGKKSGTEILGLCLVVVTETPQTSGKQQSEIDDAMTGVLSSDFWKSTYKAQGAQDIVISNVGSRATTGRKVHFVYSEFTSKGQDGTSLRMKAHEEVHALPGRMHDIGCIAQTEKYDLAKADFDAILQSYSPQSGLIAQAPSSAGSPSVLTLYARADFDGVARVVKGEVPNITYVSWPTRSGSATVSGFGAWQVCEGVDFTGTCSVLSGARTAPVDTMLRIGSARPISSANPFLGAASAVSTNALIMLNEAGRRFNLRQ
ncbi:MAG: beta/gamma crystallin-related protein [Micropepsaceae bacterium]